MKRGHGARRQIEQVLGLAGHQLADAAGFLLRQTRQADQMLFHFAGGFREQAADLARFHAHLARGAQQAFAFRHRLAHQQTGIMLGLGGAFADQCLRAFARILQCRRQTRQHRGGRFAGFLQALGLARKGAGQLRGAGGGIGHDQLQVTFGIAGHHLELAGFPAQGGDRLLHAGALLGQRAFEDFAFLFQLLHQLVHLGAMLFLARQHELRPAHGGVRHVLDPLRLGIQGLGRFQRRFGGLGDGTAEAGGLHIQRLGRHLQGAFGGFHHRLQLRGAAGHGFAGAGGGIGQPVAQGFQPAGFLVEAGRDAVAAHLGTGAGVIQSGDLLFQHGLKRAHALEGVVETGVQAVQLTAHRAGKTGGVVGRGLIGGKQPVGGDHQQAGGFGHGDAARQEGGDPQEQEGRQHGRGCDQRLGGERQSRQPSWAKPTPDKGPRDPDPEQRQHAGRPQCDGAKAAGAQAGNGRRRGGLAIGGSRGLDRFLHGHCRSEGFHHGLKPRKCPAFGQLSIRPGHFTPQTQH